jgi:poly(glycerol-phosphate) alpha-glucosyltransferase
VASRLGEYSYLLLSSTAEGSPLCVLEALAAGCLPIAYDIPFGPADVIRDGVNGFLVPAGDVEALAAKIVELHRMPPAAVEEMRRRAIATVASYGEAEVFARWRSELRAGWRRKTWLMPRARRALRRRLAA